MRRLLSVVAPIVLALAPPRAAQDTALEVDSLEAALQVAAWLETQRVEQETGSAWRTQAEGPSVIAPDLYTGSAGVVLFHLEAYHLTQRAELARRAKDGADYLLALVHSKGKELPAGLYTGLSGIAFTLLETHAATEDERYLEGASFCIDLLQRSATKREGEAGIAWNETTDIISGSAGVGLFLLYAARELDRDDLVELAALAGDRLIELGIPEHGGTKWRMSPGYERTMPNFSHGAAGIGHFLVSLHEVTREKRFLEAAAQAGTYLRTIATPRGPADENAALIFHSEPGGEELFYLGWCHGPAGTVRFLRTLARVSGDESWNRDAARLLRGMKGSGLPDRSPGLWNNAGVCCGDAGIANLLLSVGEHAELRSHLVRDVLRRSTTDETGRRWTHAEHRVRPDFLTTQTGYMQGAAGIGLLLLHVYASETGRERAIVLPDDPF